MNKKKSITDKTLLLSSSIVSFLILLVIVFVFPVGFSGYSVKDVSAPFWYAITSTGGFYGGIAVFIGLLSYLLIHFKRYSKRKSYVYFFMGIVFLVLTLTAGATLFLVKDSFREIRPSHTYLIEKGVIENNGKDFFDLSTEQRRIFLKNMSDASKDSLKNIYPPILNDWIYQSGYSFPSGHSQTAFFLGTIIAFVIIKTSKNKYLILIPFLWAVLVSISRVVIGIHYPVDVAGGAALGLVLAIIVTSLRKVNKIFD